MLDRLATYPHSLRVLVEARLCGLDKAALAALPGVAERGLGSELFRPRVEGRTSELVVFCPMRQQAPLHHLRHALAIHRADGDQHRRRGRLIPIGLEVRRRRVGRELQLDFDFGVIGGETNTAARILSIAIHRVLVECHAQDRYRTASIDGRFSSRT